MKLQYRMRNRVSAFALAAVAGTLGLAGVASAQTTQAEPAVNQVEDIIVTAQKREQNLQDVPIVVTALSQEALQGAGVHDIKDLQILTPGLIVTSTSNEAITTARIRGVGTVGDNPGLESSVLVTIDGVYRPRNGVGFGDLGNLQRIEVLKGPQGTLFGKNASAGVINIITETPSFTFGANAELTGGNYGQMGGSAYITGPIVADTLAGSLYFADRQRDGYLDVVTSPGPRTNDRGRRPELLHRARPVTVAAVRQAVGPLHRRLHQPRRELLRRHPAVRRRLARLARGPDQSGAAGFGRHHRPPSTGSPAPTAIRPRRSRTRASRPSSTMT
jgi:iron complex outermembrane receptor protein